MKMEELYNNQYEDYIGIMPAIVRVNAASVVGGLT